MSRYIHDDVKEIMDDAMQDPINEHTPCIQSWTEEQKRALNTMLQYAWNRGYKGGYADALEE